MQNVQIGPTSPKLLDAPLEMQIETRRNDPENQKLDNPCF